MDEVIEKDKGFRKNFIWNIIGTTFNAFNSLFFMIIITRVNGLENAGIFTLAFSTACILYIIGIYAGRIYQVTEASKEITDKDYIANRIISCIIMIVIVIFFVIINQYDVYKSSIFIILTMYKALEAFSDVLYGIMQKNELLEKAGKSTLQKILQNIQKLSELPNSKKVSATIFKEHFELIDEIINDIKFSKIRAIINICLLDKVIKKYPLGFDTYISSQINPLSGGEKNLVILARTLIEYKDIYILDEVLSELNYEKEIEVLKNIDRNIKSTIIYISHKKSNIFKEVFNVRKE